MLANNPTGGTAGETGQGLAVLTDADRMLAQVVTTQDALDLMSHADAAKWLAKKMKLGVSAVNHATVIRVAAEMRLADIIDAGQKAGEIATPHVHADVRREDIRGLDELGVKRQRLAEARVMRNAFSEADIRKMADRATEDDNEFCRKSVVRLAQSSREHEPTQVETPPLPDKLYRCIVIDPPWPVKKIVREVRPGQDAYLDYPTWPLDKIKELPIRDLADPTGCHVYLWVTHKFLDPGLELLKAWGVEYECLMTWDKPTGMTPFSWMYNTEHVRFGRVGNLPLEQTGQKLSFQAPSVRGGHSTKPDIFYERVRAASPGPRLDMFARKQRDGFDVWGDEVSNVQSSSVGSTA